MKKLLCMLLILLLACPLALAREEDVEYMQVTTQTAVVTSDRVNIRSGPGTKYFIVTVANTGDSFAVTRPYGDWYQIKMPDGTLACVHKDYVRIDEATEVIAIPKEAQLDASVTKTVMPTMLKQGQTFSIRGAVTSNIPLIGVKITIRNDNRLTRESQAEATFDAKDNVTSYDLQKLDAKLNFSGLVPGEKTLTVAVATPAQTATIYTHRFTVLGAMQDPASLNDKCNIVATFGNTKVLTDTYTGTIWRPSSSTSKITVTAPADAEPGAFTIAWETVPTGFTVDCKNASGQVVSHFDRSNTPEMLVNFWEVDTATRTVEIVLQDTKSGICELKLFQNGRVSPVQQNWTPTPEKLDLLLVSAHQDDEWLFFAGALPTYIDRGKEVTVLYMANCNRMRYGEAMAGMWHGGIHNYPIFLNLEDYFANSMDQALQRWGKDTTVTLLVRQLRRYKPEVVLTHAENGEYGHAQHMATSWAVKEAVQKARDESYDPESVREYGAWEVKKLYLHLYEKNTIHMDWNQPLATFDGRTGLEMATIGFNMHYLIWDDYTIDYGKKYDYTAFGLYYSAVGEDVAKNDFFENID